MTIFEKQVLELVQSNDGIKTNEIAEKLQCDRSKVSDVLFGSLQEYCQQDNYKWYFRKKENPLVPEDVEQADSDLSALCSYYLNCLSLEQNTGVSVAADPESKEYMEVSSVSSECFGEAGVSTFLQRASSGTNLSVFLGYPLGIGEVLAEKAKKKQKKITPVFLFPIEYGAGKTSISKIPIVNPELVRQYTNRDKDSFIYDLIELEKDLDLSERNADFDLQDLTARLQAIRAWNWKERINPAFISKDGSIDEIKESGIYNRAILFVCERSPFTVGLESELKLLSELPESRYKGTALHAWIHSTDEKTTSVEDGTEETVLLEVLPLNTEQETAIQKALTSPLTIVTGPPGTGKSQVVTDLLINAVWQGKSALFTSKNNKAVDVVEARVNGIANRPILFRLGANSIVSRFVEVSEELLATSAEPNFNAFERKKADYAAIVQELKAAKKKKSDFTRLRNELDAIEKQFCEIREKTIPYFETVACVDAEDLSQKLNAYISAFQAAQKETQSGLTKLFWFAFQKKRQDNLRQTEDALNMLLKRFGAEDLSTDPLLFDSDKARVSSLISDVRLTCEYKKLLQKMQAATPLETIDKSLASYKHKLAERAKDLWVHYLETKQVKLSSDLRKKLFDFVSAMKLLKAVDLSDHPTLQQQFRELQQDLAPYLPCWAVTSLSARGRIPFKPELFDLVIIDEASQCDIASILPLLYRAKSAVIIGDAKQLRHISSVSEKQDFNMLQKYGVGFGWSYVANSLYDKAVGLPHTKPADIISLRDHHRSYAEIINFSNAEFYNGQLRIATNYDKLIAPKTMPFGVYWIDVPGKTVRPADGSAVNEAEAARIIQMLEESIVAQRFTGSVGVVTPFRAQAERVRSMIESNEKLRSYLYKNNAFWADTVHKFQGDEKDIIFFSPVISDGTASGAITFLNNTVNLFNVAITRARSSLIVVGDQKYCEDSGVSYLAHFVAYVKQLHANTDNAADAIRDYGEKYPHVSNAEQVSEWEKVFYAALYDHGIKAFPQYPVDKYKLDLAIIDDDRKLDIEIDGEMYHKDWNGELCYRDQLRNQRLFEIGWDVKRFWVYQIQDALPWCIDQVKNWLNTRE